MVELLLSLDVVVLVSPAAAGLLSVWLASPLPAALSAPLLLDSVPLADFLDAFLLSVIYQPLPLKWIEGLLICRTTWSLSQAGQLGAVVLEKVVIFSN